ncbi:hypothetical protein ABT039_08505 [Streptomyces lasiicapitis]|uniref:hypothetical protein n=1 Tax=Streptomyces lasiicapitis TaxID=1923961 RepID=UPI003326F37E
MDSTPNESHCTSTAVAFPVVVAPAARRGRSPSSLHQPQSGPAATTGTGAADASAHGAGPTEPRRAEGHDRASGDAARQVARFLSRFFARDEPDSYPTGSEGGGTCLHLTVDTLPTQAPDPALMASLTGSRSQARRTYVVKPA